MSDSNVSAQSAQPKVCEQSVGLSDVLQNEVFQIEDRRSAMWGPGPKNKVAAKDTEEEKITELSGKLNRMEALGLAMSGGGIRSATFALGVIQFLAEQHMLRYVDYLSTVSGGGYIGSWLSKLILEKSPKSSGTPKDRLTQFEAIEESLRPPVSEQSGSRSGDETPREHRAIGWLREFSNYLAPRVGLFSADVWSIATIWVRNTILNQIILVALLGSLILIPYILRDFPGWAKPCFGYSWPYVSFGVATLLFGAAIGVLTRGVRSVAVGHNANFRQRCAVSASLLLYFSAYFSAVALSDLGSITDSFPTLPDYTCHSQQLPPCDVTDTCLPFLRCLVVTLVRSLLTDAPESALTILRYLTFAVVAIGSTVAAFAAMKTERSTLCRLVSAATASILATGVFSTGLYLLRPLLGGSDPEQRMVLGTSAILLLFGLQVVLILGMLGRAVDDLVREWWARVGAWLSIIAVTMGVLTLAAFYAPCVFALIPPDFQIPTVLSWVAANVFGISAAASPATSGEREKRSLGPKAKELAVSLAPAVFAIGIIILISSGIFVLMTVLNMNHENGGLFLGHYSEANCFFCDVLVFLALLVVVAIPLSLRVDVNEFSMHNFYRNRLVRCYLGATGQSQTKRDRLTNFSREDDLKLEKLQYGPVRKDDKEKADQTDPIYLGPIPIINAAINLATPDAGKQERRADSFIFTPYHCGFNAGTPTDQEDDQKIAARGYLPTNKYCQSVTLGHAFTVSGAAASPNMGYHTSGAIALLMTIFNVRLGWWFPNPSKTYNDRMGLTLGIRPLIEELFAWADKKGPYIYASDGGHFENLAVYELLRRRCRYIICCDAEEDGDFCFGGLGGLVRKARADFGIEIQIDPRSIAKRNDKGDSEVHCAVGNIWYPESGLTGTILYLKSSVTGDEPTDILQYRAAEKKFPHQTTGDQFFSESQFESYRRLGYHVAQSAFSPIRNSRGKLPFQYHDQQTRPSEALRRTFLELREAWGVAPCYDIKNFTDLSLRLDTIMERLRQDAKLAFLIPEFYLQWQQVCAGAKSSAGRGDTGDGTTPTPPTKGGTPTGKARCSERTLTDVLCDDDTRQSVFVFHHSLIQLMEDCYSLLDLERNYKHPDVHGWMNLFRHWSWNPGFRLVYSVIACTFGSRFQSFCDRHLDLRVGEVRVDRVHPVNDPKTQKEARSIHADLEKSLRSARFNHVELKLLSGLLSKLSSGTSNARSEASMPTSRQLYVYAVRAVLDLQIPEDQKNDERLPSDLTIGFAVVEEGGKRTGEGNSLRWIRIQDHLRRMGFGRRALLEMWKNGTVKQFEEAPRPEYPNGAPPPGELDWYEFESERNIRWVKSTLPWNRTP